MLFVEPSVGSAGSDAAAQQTSSLGSPSFVLAERTALDCSDHLAVTMMNASSTYTDRYVAMMAREGPCAANYGPLAIELPFFEAANYLLAWTDQLLKSLDVEENGFIDLIVELRPMFKHAFGRVDTKGSMAECIASRQNQYELEFDPMFEPSTRDSVWHSYLSSLLLRAEVEECLFLAVPELPPEVAVDARKERRSRAALASLEATVVAEYLGSARTLIQGNAN